MDLGHSHPMMNASNLIGLSGASGTPPPSGGQPNIHPGCIPSTGRIGGQVMPQNLAFGGGNGAAMQVQGNGGGVMQQQQQQNYMASNMTNGAMSNSNSLKFNNHGSLQQQPQAYMHHN